jgi:predicted site-specific integrase-resolvase
MRSRFNFNINCDLKVVPESKLEVCKGLIDEMAEFIEILSQKVYNARSRQNSY